MFVNMIQELIRLRDCYAYVYVCERLCMIYYM
jgi:hypothetical protein